MCLIVFAWQAHPRYRLVLAANRDEFYQRPTLALHRWADTPQVIAGRDLQGGGTWCGLSSSGRFAALTNIRAPQQHNPEARSRGELVSAFLQNDQMTPSDYAQQLSQQRLAYNGYNLLFGDAEQLYYYHSVQAQAYTLKPGLYGLSNAALDQPWPKVQRAKAGLHNCLQSAELDPEALLALLADAHPAPDTELPSTGVTLEWERKLSPIFIPGPDYGTRASTVWLLEHSGRVQVWERGFPERETRYMEWQRADGHSTL